MQKICHFNQPKLVKIISLIKNFRECYQVKDYICQIHVTSPFLQLEHLQTAQNKLDEGYDSVFGADVMQQRLWRKESYGYCPINHNPMKLEQTQDLPKYYCENSYLYAFKPAVLDHGNRIGKNPYLLEIGFPYNLDIELYAMAKQSDDALQMVEQILPYFQPDYTLTIKDMEEMGIARDIPIVLNSINYEDNYRGDYTERRAIMYTLDFTTKFYLYGPDNSTKVIKTVQADAFTDMPDQSPKREQRYTVSPKPITAEADDDFGFNESTSFFSDAKAFNPETGEDQ